jgi:hypothetical protein
MSHSLEEKEAVQHIDLDQHDHRRSNDIKESDNVEYADGIQNHVPWTSQGFTQSVHHVKNLKQQLK